MRKDMKSRIVIGLSILVCASILLSCERQLSDGFLTRENPNDLTDENFWKTEKDFESGIASIYSVMAINGVFGGRGWEMMNGRSDEFRSFNPTNETMYGWFIASPTNDYPYMRYSFLYKGIFRANHLLKMMDEKGDFFDENTRNRIQAEARCLRGIYHFYLLQDFGYIAYVEEPYQTLAEMEANIFQAPQDTVFTKIVADLTFAAQYLPENWSENYIGRVTKGTAKAFTGLTYVNWMEFQKAADVLGELIGSNPNGPSVISGYQLIPNYADLWTQSGAENNIESIFEAQFSGAGGPNLWTWDNNEASLASIIGKSATYQEQGWLNFYVYMNQNETLNDVWQYQEFFKDPYKNYLPASTQKVSDVFDPRLTGGLAFQWSAAGQTGKAYGGKDFISGGASGVPGALTFWNNGFGLRKAMSFWEQNEPEQSTKNWSLMRYAEVLLLKAEAENELGNVQNALRYIDPVRARADLPRILDQPDAGSWTQQDVRNEIRHQRYLELFGEGKRWYDMLRYERTPNTSFNLKDTLFAHDWPQRQWNNGLHAENYDVGIDEYLPIPTRALDANRNLKDNFSHSTFESSHFKH